MVHVGRPGDRVVAPVAARRAVALGPLIVILATSTAAAPRAVASTTILLPITWCKIGSTPSCSGSRCRRRRSSKHPKSIGSCGKLTTQIGGELVGRAIAVHSSSSTASSATTSEVTVALLACSRKAFTRCATAGGGRARASPGPNGCDAVPDISGKYRPTLLLRWRVGLWVVLLVCSCGRSCGGLLISCCVKVAERSCLSWQQTRRTTTLLVLVMPRKIGLKRGRNLLQWPWG